MIQGWVKLHRKLIENPIFLKPELLQLFIYCLLKANHEPNKIIFNGKEQTIETGQFITGRDVLSKELKQNGRSTYDRLKILENLEILSIKTNNRFSLVTIVNYSFYQLQNTNSNSDSNNTPTTSQQQANTNKNVKNEKKLKTLGDFTSLVESYSDNPEVTKTIFEFVEFRKSIKKQMTYRALELLLKALDEHQDKIAVLNQSILKGWSGIFPINEKTDTKKGNGFNNPYKMEG